MPQNSPVKKRTVVFILSECMKRCLHSLRRMENGGAGTASLSQFTHGQVPAVSAGHPSIGDSMSLIHRIRLFLLLRRADALLRRVRKQQAEPDMTLADAKTSR